MPTAYLVRHGEVENPNHVVYADLPGFHLSPTGVLQAVAAADHLADVRLDQVITSPLERAVETASAIAERHGLTPQRDARLLETRQYPSWTGHRWDDIPTLFPGQLEGYLTDASALADVTETIEEVATRVIAAITSWTASFETIAVVGHQDPLQAARLSMTGRSLSHLLDDPPSHASVITLTTDGEVWLEVNVWRPERRNVP